MLRLTTTADGAVAVVTMEDGENRIGTRAVQEWNGAIDQVIANTSISSMVVAGSGRYWSTGLDLDEVTASTPDERGSLLAAVDHLLARLLTLPVVTVAAINGHAYAAGALLALALDYRIMRDDRGYFCLPSIDVGIPFSRGMTSLITAKLPQPIAHDLVVSCRRMGGSEAVATGVVDRAVGPEAVLASAMRLATSYAGKDRNTMATVKERMYASTVAGLRSEG